MYVFVLLDLIGASQFLMSLLGICHVSSINPFAELSDAEQQRPQKGVLGQKTAPACHRQTTNVTSVIFTPSHLVASRSIKHLNTSHLISSYIILYHLIISYRFHPAQLGSKSIILYWKTSQTIRWSQTSMAIRVPNTESRKAGKMSEQVCSKIVTFHTDKSIKGLKEKLVTKCDPQST